ncbi:hypothetical protein H6P81_021097 [Aristolochia fimbriata]|uniref:Uncharacterized protein n=1 Tax=Aristolochia fimbriata TaxID=158543 RepID=A0AAV7DWG2_ARIFI|nr:hypothetical protein H6P81_021097 [Aristolochia fimbriata]
MKCPRPPCGRFHLPQLSESDQEDTFTGEEYTSVAACRSGTRRLLCGNGGSGRSCRGSPQSGDGPRNPASGVRAASRLPPRLPGHFPRHHHRSLRRPVPSTPLRRAPGPAPPRLPPPRRRLAPAGRCHRDPDVAPRPGLRPLLSAAEPTVLVVDIFGTDVFDVAHELRLPKYIFFTSTALLLSLMMWLPALDEEVHGEYVDLESPIRVPGCKPIPVVDLMDPLLDRSDERYRWFLYQASRFPLADGILINTSQVLEPVTLKALSEDPHLKRIPTPAVYPVGPVTESDVGPLSCRESPSPILKWLDGQPPGSVIYVSFGSGGTLSAEQVTELAWGLELSQQRFVWVVRAPTGSEGPGSYFTAGGGAGEPSEYLPDGFLSRTRGRGLVVPSWAPQREILRHGAVGAFLSHCGWNSALESIVRGVAIIAWPLYAEQKSNASTLAEELGVAVKVVRRPGGECVGREEVERVVRLMMEGEEGKAMKTRMKELGKKVLSGLDEGGSSFRSLQEVINIWKTDSTTESR